MHSLASTRSVSCSSLGEDSTHSQKKLMVPIPSDSAIRFWSLVPLTPLFLYILETMICTFLDISDNMKYNKNTNLPPTINRGKPDEISITEHGKTLQFLPCVLFISYCCNLDFSHFSPFIMKSRNLVIIKINIYHRKCSF